jgi:hypothetical protein
MLPIIQIIPILSFIGGVVCTIIGANLIPQTVNNNGNSYIGTAEAYQADLQKAQLASYGFKVVVVGLSITGGSFLVLLFACYSHKLNCIEPRRIEPTREIKQPNKIKIHPEEILII